MMACTTPRDMQNSLSVGVYEHPQNPPAGVLAVDGLPIMNRVTARDALANPNSASAAVLAEGAELYRIYCAMCHGPSGEGDGLIADYFRRMPNLKAPYVQDYKDGWLYTILREGGFNMPSYANSLSGNERWAVVHHLRTFGQDQ
ncbi:uncharacterized protein METZ01_LOCUS370165 [marine metagenome]|uniref:Cytochrome c domain-containing protein n=1 Tax=marine metagenome TaxID=408172 RepID=A0A382T7N1_9ZZZZ